MMAAARPLIVFDFDDTLFPTSALRAFSEARVARDPEFTLGGGAAGLLAAWDELAAGVLGRVAERAGRLAELAIVSAGDPEWVGSVLQQYMPRFRARAQQLIVSVHAGVRASNKAAQIARVADGLCAAGAAPDALVVIGDHALDERAAKNAQWAGSDRLVARAFVGVAPYDSGAGGAPLGSVRGLAEELGRLPVCVAEALAPRREGVSD